MNTFRMAGSHEKRFLPERRVKNFDAAGIERGPLAWQASTLPIRPLSLGL